MRGESSDQVLDDVKLAPPHEMEAHRVCIYKLLQGSRLIPRSRRTSHVHPQQQTSLPAFCCCPALQVDRHASIAFLHFRFWSVWIAVCLFLCLKSLEPMWLLSQGFGPTVVNLQVHAVMGSLTSAAATDVTLRLSQLSSLRESEFLVGWAHFQTLHFRKWHGSAIDAQAKFNIMSLGISWLLTFSRHPDANML